MMAANPGRSAREQTGERSARGGTVSEDDLSQRDLSQIDDGDLTSEERRVLQQRFNDFLTRLRQRAGPKTPVEEKPKRIARWDPTAISRRH